eukprot:TRINITY_DN596_c0_g5_i1.p1 TRINITY_DN596_c0_g5~~TRINITY_DN596_c0_g5_i1.p1  ORF type:complete len:134 (-),score=34.63 TRINITY_DN596_c0_g5_i1:515-916(-)
MAQEISSDNKDNSVIAEKLGQITQNQNDNKTQENLHDIANDNKKKDNDEPKREKFVMRQGDDESTMSTLISTVKNVFASKDENLQVAQGFDIHRYMGLWYELARLPIPLELHMCNVVSHCSLNDGILYTPTHV